MHGIRVLLGCAVAWAFGSVLIWLDYALYEGHLDIASLPRTLYFGAWFAVPMTAIALAGALVAAMIGTTLSLRRLAIGGAVTSAGACLLLPLPILHSVMFFAWLALSAAVGWAAAFGVRTRVRFAFISDRAK